MAKRIFCNMCGKPFDLFDFQNNFSIDRYAGYGSIYDGEHLQLDLCCECMDEIIASCEIPPMESDEKARLVDGYKTVCMSDEDDGTDTADEVEVEVEFSDDCIYGTADIADKFIQACKDCYGPVPHRVTVKKVSKDEPAR